ncbi:CAP domain-containing protein [Companilactobacillus sp. HBUAS59699]|uniref:CAP domain-containing protein n=1 Tax=Companilactobacillus sp. HBUAS59699 TaxID=3109358 RepID=UPI002FEF5202
MKFTSKSAAIVAALAMATTGVLAVSNNETTADAATVATVHSGVTARLYTKTGQLITNRALAPSTPWLVGKIAQINGQTMYQVSTNEYLKASDSDLSGQQQQASNKRVAKAIYGTVSLYRDDTNSMANRSLAKGSAWQVGKFIRNKNNQEFIQVSTHEYADAAMFSYNVRMTNPTYIADFGTNTDFTVIKVGNGDIAGSTSTNTTTTTPSQNQNNNTGSTTVTTPSTSTNTGSNSSSNGSVAYPSTSAVESAVLSSINAERASKGLSPLTVDPTLASIAKTRANEITTNFSHTDANGTELYKKYLHAQTSYLSQGENISDDHWGGSETRTPEQLAGKIMDSFRAEGTDASWNHYKAVINPNATKIGIGVTIGSDGLIYTAEDFA